MKFLIFISLVGYAMSADWSYDNFGPDMWKSDYAVCGGERQSPINIPPADSNHLKYEDLGTLSFTGYDNTNLRDLSITNNGHTAVVNIDNNGRETYIEGGSLVGKYTALQFHFHWGPDDTRGSEHTFRGLMYPLEMHIVHYKDSYGSVDTALSKPDGAAVVGVFFEISDTDNPNLDPIISRLGAIEEKGDTQSISLNFETLFGDKTNEFYRYKGSLTTPTCNEAVIWTVLEGKNKISSSQLDKFRKLRVNTTNSDYLTINYRPTQPLYSREVIKNYESEPEETQIRWFLQEPSDQAQPTDFHWEYHGSSGPEYWKYYYPTCTGHRQSPINIPPLYESRIAYEEEMDLSTLEFINYDKIITGKIKNNGHTVQVDIENPDVYIMNGGLDGMYRAAQFHFHWGADNHHGSEHTVNGHSYPLELHIVHYKVSHESISDAVMRDDGLAVVGFLFQVADTENSQYDTIINKLNDIQYKDQSTSIDGFSLEHLTLSNLRKNSTSGIHYPYYRYLGGLTTPPCSQTVTWTVMNEPVHLSSNQIAAFRELAMVHQNGQLDPNEKITENYRPVQSLAHRLVFISSPGLVGGPGTSPPVGFEWGYHGDSGAQNWPAYYPTCDGDRQSPIDIPSPTSDKLELDTSLADLEFINYNSVVTGTIKNNGHTVQVDIESPAMYIQKGGLNGRYRAVQFHFHWGPDNGHGSEHTINGQSYPLELHIVHYKESYGTVSAAVKQRDGLAVVGFMFKASASTNTAYSGIISSLLDVKYKGARKAISGFNLQDITIRELKNGSHGFHNPFYRYMGGLTTPPCSQVVTWTVMQQLIGLKSDQLAEFRKLLHVTEPESHSGNDHDLLITKNYRPVQELKQRRVYTSYPLRLYDDDTSSTPGINCSMLYLALILVVSMLFR